MNELAYNSREFGESALAAIREAGEICRDAWGKPSRTRHKGRIDLVTETDLAVQEFLREKLARILPEASFLGEEDGGAGETPEGLVWIVDPVDGTTNFAHRLPFFAVSVALCAKRDPLFGAVFAPMLNDLYWASAGGGAFHNGKPLAVSAVSELTDALVATGFPYEPGPVMDGILGALGKVIPATQGLRRIGAASLDLAYVAAGSMDAFYEAGLKPWDMAAGWLLVREAGGVVTRPDGAPVYPGAPLLATNGRLHAALVDLLKGVYP